MQLMYHVLWPQRNTVFFFRIVQVSWSGITPGSEGAWNNVWCASEMDIKAGHSAVRSALRKIFPITQACSHVKWAKVKLFSSLARESRSRVGGGSVESILLLDEVWEE
jgi:hypothetical protein